MKKLRAFSLVVCAAAAFIPATLRAQDAEVDSIAARALSQFISSWNAAASGDVKGRDLYRDLYWPDADLVDPSGSVWNDQEGIVQMHVDLWNTAFKGSVIKGSVRKARRLSPTVAGVDFDLELSMYKQAPSGAKESNGVVQAHLKMVMQKRDNAWKVITSQNTFFFGTPPAAPSRE